MLALLATFAIHVVSGLAQCPPLGSTLPVANYVENDGVKGVMQKIDSVLDSQLASNNTAFTVTMGFINNSNPILEYHNAPTAYNKSGAHLLNTDTQFVVASVSKLFTAYAIRILAEQQKLQLTAPVTTYIPGLLNLDNQAQPHNAITTTQWQSITIDALLSHLADIAEDLGDSDFANVPGNYSASGLPSLNASQQGTHCGDAFNPYQRPCTEKDFFDNWGKKYPVYAPFTTPVYSNIGYALLGLVIEKVSGVPYAQYMQDAVFSPLGLNRTSVDHPISLSDTFITQETADGDISEGFLASAGAIYSSSSDLYTLGRSILSSTLLSPANTQAWLKPRTFTSSSGTFVGEVWEIGRGLNLTGGDGHIVDVYTKAGNLDLYSSIVALVPDYGFVFSMTSAGPDASGGAVQVVLSLVLEALIPALEKANKEQAKELYMGTYTSEGDSITLIVDDGPGLLVSKFSVNGADDVVGGIGELLGAEPKDTTLRLYPTDLVAGTQMAWQGVYNTLSTAEAQAEDAKLFLSQGTCQTWSDIALYSYGQIPLDSFILTANGAGKILSVNARAWRTVMSRT